MTIIKLSRFEKVAGVFVLGAVGLALVSTVMIAFKQGWFESSVDLETVFRTGDGIFPGSEVQMNGLKVGAVDEVLLSDADHVVVKFHVKERYFTRVKSDSKIRTWRPFLIGNKILDISMGTDQGTQIASGATLESEAGMDVMDLLGGKSLGPYLETLAGLLENLRTVVEAFSEKQRSKAIVQIFDDLQPLIRNLSTMSTEAVTILKPLNKNHQLETALTNVVQMTAQLNQAIPELAKVLKESPELTRELIGIVRNLSALTDQMTKLLPALTEIAPELPKASRRAIEAMNEAVVVLKAMQKTFLLRGSVKEVREEEAQLEKERAPSSDTGPTNEGHKENGKSK